MMINWAKSSSTVKPILLSQKATSIIFSNCFFSRIASAPGKVLITGGYLILERPNAGIVLSTNARFYAIVKPLYDELRPDSWARSIINGPDKAPQRTGRAPAILVLLPTRELVMHKVWKDEGNKETNRKLANKILHSPRKDTFLFTSQVLCVEKTVEFMDEYSLSQEDLESLMVMSKFQL
ncbi:hypothetical protein E3N88_37433 [Mikania micrantha]|uniref:Uncharacterized protein n=1 Tax=Mikania micrantha TaxID=192012 RepID=A0A5N6LR36_9ASTR|nr:hypothetical protein E3N88_37433 [Mikania micrantha]